MQLYNKDSFPSLNTPHRLVFSCRNHIRRAYLLLDLKGREKKYAPLSHCDTDNRRNTFYTRDTDNRRNTFYTRNTEALRYLYHYGNEHICFHRPLLIPELEPFFFLI